MNKITRIQKTNNIAGCELNFCLFYSIGQTPVFQKDLTGKYLFAIILLELLIYLLDLGGLSLWIRKLLIMSRQAVKIH